MGLYRSFGFMSYPLANIFISIATALHLWQSRQFTLCVCMNRHGTVYSTKCQCKAGLGQACSQAVALLFKLEDPKREGLAAIPENVTGTLQLWHVPPKRDVQAAAVKDNTFLKAQYGKTPKSIKKHRDDSKPTSEGAGGTIAIKTLLAKVSQACP